MGSLVRYDRCPERENAEQYASEVVSALGYFKTLDGARRDKWCNKTDKTFKITITIEEVECNL